MDGNIYIYISTYLYMLCRKYIYIYILFLYIYIYVYYICILYLFIYTIIEKECFPIDTWSKSSSSQPSRPGPWCEHRQLRLLDGAMGGSSGIGWFFCWGRWEWICSGCCMLLPVTSPRQKREDQPMKWREMAWNGVKLHEMAIWLWMEVFHCQVRLYIIYQRL